jgi:hypothetical protein
MQYTHSSDLLTFSAFIAKVEVLLDNILVTVELPINVVVAVLFAFFSLAGFQNNDFVALPAQITAASKTGLETFT